MGFGLQRKRHIKVNWVRISKFRATKETPELIEMNYFFTQNHLFFDMNIKLLFFSFALTACSFSIALAQAPPAPVAPPGPSFTEDASKSASDVQKLIVGDWVSETDPKQTVSFTTTSVTISLKGLSPKATPFKLYDKCPCNFEGLPPIVEMVGCFTTTSPKVCYAIAKLSEDQFEFRAIEPLIGEYYVLKKK